MTSYIKYSIISWCTVQHSTACAYSESTVKAMVKNKVIPKL